MNVLEKLTALENEAAEFGFAWEKPEQIMEQIHSECAEVGEHLRATGDKSLALQEEIGDLLHAVFSLCVFCHFDAGETLQLAVAKFERRLQAVKDIAQEMQLSHLKEHAFSELMAIWQQAKNRVG